MASRLGRPSRNRESWPSGRSVRPEPMAGQRTGSLQHLRILQAAPDIHRLDPNHAHVEVSYRASSLIWPIER